MCQHNQNQMILFADSKGPDLTAHLGLLLPHMTQRYIFTWWDPFYKHDRCVHLICVQLIILLTPLWLSQPTIKKSVKWPLSIKVQKWKDSFWIFFQRKVTEVDCHVLIKLRETIWKGQCNYDLSSVVRKWLSGLSIESVFHCGYLPL